LAGTQSGMAAAISTCFAGLPRFGLSSVVVVAASCG
jgi:hypothetical protein